MSAAGEAQARRAGRRAIARAPTLYRSHNAPVREGAMSAAARIVLVLVLVAFPLIGGDFYINLASQIFIAALFATSLNLLVGYGGLVSLGHAAWIGLAAYTSAWLYLRLGLGHWITAPLALVNTTLIAGLFGWIALRATGLGFLMITLALSQVLWGTAYRWAAVTNGDNGLSGLTRPAPFGISLDGPAAFYYFSLTVTIVAVWMMARLVNSPFGAALRGSRDESRRMSALGHNVWLVRWLTFVYSGFWGAVAGLLFVLQDDALQPDHGRLGTRCRCDPSVRRRSLPSQMPPACTSRCRPNVSDHHAVPEGHARTQYRARAAWHVERALECIPATGSRDQSVRRGASRARIGRARAKRDANDR